MSDAGEQNQQIQISTPTITQNSFNEDVETWSVTSTPWAKLVETPGREFLKGDIQAEGKAVFRILYRPVSTQDRVIWLGKIYTIENVTGSKAEGWTYLHCKTLGEGA